MKEGRFIGWMPLLVSRPRRLYLSTASQILISQYCQTVKHTFPTASLNWTAPKRKQWGHRSETCAFHISWIGHSGISAWFKKNFRRLGSLSTLSTCLTICQFHNKFSTEFFCGILFRTVTCLIPWNINKLYQTNIMRRAVKSLFGCNDSPGGIMVVRAHTVSLLFALILNSRTQIEKNVHTCFSYIIC